MNDSQNVILQRKKPILVVKKRRQSKPAVVALARPALALRSTLAVAAASALRAQHEQEQKTRLEQEAKDDAKDKEFFGDDESDVVGQAVVRCDTLQWIHSCQTAPAVTTPTESTTHPQCLVLPLSSHTTDILSILECTLYSGGLEQAVVSRQLAELLQTNQLRKLSPPQSCSRAGTAVHTFPPPSVYLTIQDYQRGVWDAHRQRYNVANPTANLTTDNATAAVDWFVQNLKHWTTTGDRIAQVDLERVCRQTVLNSSFPFPELDPILDYLVHIQVLLPCYSESSFQLWLPSWPVVLQVWNKLSKSLGVQLQRSMYKELSLKTLVRTHCRSNPISVPLVVDYLESIRKVRRATKSSGEFVQLL